MIEMIRLLMMITIASQLLCGATSAESGNPEPFPSKFDALHILSVGHKVKVEEAFVKKSNKGEIVRIL